MRKQAAKPPIIQITPEGTFRTQFSRGGVRFSKTSKTKSEVQAYIDKYASPTLTLELFVENNYKKSPEWRALKGPSKDAYTSRLAKICELIGSVPISLIDKAVVDGYVTDRYNETTKRGGPPADDTVRQELVILGRVLNVAVGYGKIAFNPASRVKKPRQNRRHIRVSPDQRNGFLLLAAGNVSWPPGTFRGRPRGERPTDDRDREAGRFLFVLSELGGRASELAKLPAKNLDFANECIHLDDTKANEPDRRYFSNVGARLLRQQLDYIENHRKNPKGLLFPTRNGTPHDYQYSVDIVRDLGLVDEEFHSHACRREFVSSARELGMSDADLAKLVGVDIATLARYDVSTGQTAEEIERRQKFQRARNQQLRDAMGDARAAEELGQAVEASIAHGTGASEIAALDAQFALSVAPAPSTADVLRQAVARGELSADQLLALLLEAKDREAK